MGSKFKNRTALLDSMVQTPWPRSTDCDCKHWGSTSAAYALFDQSANQVVFEGYDIHLNDSDELRFGDLAAGDIVVTFNGTNFTITPAVSGGFLLGADGYLMNTTLKGTLTVGKDDTGHDVILYGATSGNYFHWDESADDLILVGTATGLIHHGTTEASAIGTASAVFDGGVSVAKKLYVGSDINVANAAVDILVKANTDSALEFYDSTTKFIDIDTRNTVTGVSNVTLTAMPATIVAASGVTKVLLNLVPGTTTLTGSTGVTAMNGLGLYIAQPTVTDDNAVTVTTASTVYIAGAPTGAGLGPATLTNAYALNVVGAVNITGNTQQTGTLTVGVDDTGHDVKFFGATASKYWEWDESADTMNVAGTAAIATADLLTVGGVIVPQHFYITFNIPAGAAAADFDGVIPIPDAAEIVSVTERHQTAGSDAGAVTLMVTKAASGTAKAAGTDCLSAGINLKATADTNQAGTLHGTPANYQFAAGDGIALVTTGTLTALDGVTVTIKFKRI